MWTVVTEGLNWKFCLTNLNFKKPYVAHGYNVGHCRPKLFRFLKVFFCNTLQ